MIKTSDIILSSRARDLKEAIDKGELKNGALFVYVKDWGKLNEFFAKKKKEEESSTLAGKDPFDQSFYPYCPVIEKVEATELPLP